MILFIAPNPYKAKKKEGFLQRVAAIDDLYVHDEKVYFDDLKTESQKAQALVNAELIYVHSVYNASKIRACYKDLGGKIITDLHGVVPEEEEFRDDMEAAHVMAATEEEVFRYGAAFVAVSDAMVAHFDAKYPIKSQKRHWVVLPIHNDALISSKLPSIPHDQRPVVVYAGGGQAWQNVDKMIDATENMGDLYQFVFLSHDKEAFARIESSEHVVVNSVPSDKVGAYYDRAQLGFILRDDTLVNQVACPTKLIEYLQYGVVPIVLSAHIGDFDALGFKYVTLDQFLQGPISGNILEKYRQRNYEVFEEFTKKAHAGKKRLASVSHSIQKRAADMKIPLEGVAWALQCTGHQEEIIRLRYRVEVYAKKIGEYADMAEHYKKEYESVTSRRRPQILSKIANRAKRSH